MNLTRIAQWIGLDALAEGTKVRLLRGAVIGVVLTLAAVGELRAETGKAVLERFLSETTTFEAAFSQSIYDEARRLKERSTGSLRLHRPGKFRWSYDDPDGQELVGDGAKLWVHDRGLEQVTVRPLDAALKDTPAVLLTSQEPVDDNFQVDEAGEAGGATWVQLLPKGEDAAFGRIRIGFAAGVLRFMLIEDSFGNITELAFESVEINSPIAEDVFAFTPPPGADVIEN